MRFRGSRVTSAGMSKADHKPLLPAGFHPRDWDQLNALCVEKFPAESSRPGLVAKLGAFVAELRGMGVVGDLWIDGSFATEKPNPSDVDLVWVIDPACNAAINANAARLEQLFGPTKGAKALYGCDAYAVPRYKAHDLAYWRGLFGFGHDEVTPKGIIVFSL